MEININGMWLQQVSQVMDILQVKHKTVASNIANTNTPGYIRQTVDFKNELEKVMSGPDMLNLPMAQVNKPANYSPMIYQDVEVKEDVSNPGRTDGNNVNLEDEMVELTQISQVYKVLSRAAAKKFQLASFIIKGGR